MKFLAIYWIVLSAWTLYSWWENRKILSRTAPVSTVQRRRPFVSVLIPARNEEKRIAPLLEGLARQDYPSYEVLVLDDQSTDGTLKLLRRFARERRRFKAIPGKPMPEGWRGKPWACHQLSRKAKGEYLLFLDADTWHGPGMLQRAIQHALLRKTDVLSLLPRQVTASWMEALVVPVMVFNFFVAFPAKWAYRTGSRLARLAGVSGQFILARKRAYRSFGGHGAVKNEIAEDLRLGAAAATAGFRVALADGSDMACARMYTGPGDVWEGFTKNFFPASEFSVPKFLAAQWFIGGYGILPFVVLALAAAGRVPFGLFTGGAFAMALSQILIRADQAHRHGFTPYSVPFHPLGCLLFAVIGWNSFFAFVFGGGGVWKGRRLTAN